MKNLSPHAFFLAYARRRPPQHSYRAGDDVERWKACLLPKVLATLGAADYTPGSAAELMAEWSEGAVIKQRWRLDVDRDLSVVAYVNRPSGLEEGERRPAILCWHGHGGFGKEAVMGNRSSADLRSYIESLNADYGQQMAEEGFVTCAIDWMGNGDSVDGPVWRGRSGARARDGRDPCNLYYLNATMLGLTPLGINVEHGGRLVDLVSSLPFVDADRFGVMGLSGGGTLAIWSALSDERLKVVEVSCYSALFEDFAFKDLNYCGSQIAPGLYTLVDVPDLQGLLTPRPLLLDIGVYDEVFGVDSALDCSRRVREIYAAAGVDGNLEVELFGGGHGWSGRARSKDFFGRHLTA